MRMPSTDIDLPPFRAAHRVRVSGQNNVTGSARFVPSLNAEDHNHAGANYNIVQKPLPHHSVMGKGGRMGPGRSPGRPEG